MLTSWESGIYREEREIHFRNIYIWITSPILNIVDHIISIFRLSLFSGEELEILVKLWQS